jgi:hypothetical protein
VAVTGQPYAFTGDDPLNATDPLGMNPKAFDSTQTANDLPVSVTWKGNAGDIYYQASPNGAIQWGIRTTGDLLGGTYDVTVYVNDKKYDEKTGYIKGRVHGSINAKFLKHGTQVFIVGQWTSPAGEYAVSGWNHFTSPGKY